MHAFDARHFNIRGRRGTGDESGRPGRVWPQAVETLRQRFDDLLCKEYAEVIVGQQRQCAASFGGPVLQHDAAGLGNSDGCCGQNPIK